MLRITEQSLNIVDQYISAGRRWPASTREIAEWAMANNLWQTRPSSEVSRCADQLARALRTQYFIDAQGRRVRTKHAARIKRDGVQITLWGDIRSAPYEHMHVSLQQRRLHIVSNCRQLQVDVDSYNDNNSPERPIQMIFDFTEDLREIDAVENDWGVVPSPA